MKDEFVVVPKVPTMAMLLAAGEAWIIPDPSPFDKGDEARRAIYAAMLAAAPASQAGYDVCQNCHRPKSGPFNPVELCGCATLTYTPAASQAGGVVEGLEFGAVMRDLRALEQELSAPSTRFDAIGPLGQMRWCHEQADKLNALITALSCLTPPSIAGASGGPVVGVVRALIGQWQANAEQLAEVAKRTGSELCGIEAGMYERCGNALSASLDAALAVGGEERGGG